MKIPYGDEEFKALCVGVVRGTTSPGIVADWLVDRACAIEQEVESLRKVTDTGRFLSLIYPDMIGTLGGVFEKMNDAFQVLGSTLADILPAIRALSDACRDVANQERERRHWERIGQRHGRTQAMRQLLEAFEQADDVMSVNSPPWPARPLPALVKMPKELLDLTSLDMTVAAPVEDFGTIMTRSLFERAVKQMESSVLLEPKHMILSTTDFDRVEELTHEDGADRHDDEGSDETSPPSDS